MASDILLVIPAFCEFHRLPPYLRELAALLSKAKFETEILIVDDGSPPDEQQWLLQALTLGTFGACRILEPILLQKNQGKGHAIIHGWRSGGEARFYSFVDADGAIPAYEVLRLLNMAVLNVNPNPPCLWASRMPKLGKTINRNPWRHLLGRVFAHLASTFIQIPVYDNQCGFKIIPQLYYRKIASFLQEARFGFDIELLLAVHHAGALVTEIPIDWRDVPGGKLNAFRDGFAMLNRLPAIRSGARNWPKIDSAEKSS
jgi:dolichyl-phosphate beta-glucosyltransferase